MAVKYQQVDNFRGVNRAVSERDQNDFAYNQKNLDSNLIEGQLVSRDGQSVAVDTAAGTVDRFINYTDSDWGKDVLIVFNKDSVTANRSLKVYTKTAGASGTYALYGTYTYGTNQFSDRISFLLSRNGVRIGTGTGTNNKALYAGYLDRSIASDRAMFNDQIAFSDFFVTKQQWVQQSDLINGLISAYYDSTREFYYLLTFRGVEIRDTDSHIKKILNDVRAWSDSPNLVHGDIRVSGSYLFALGLNSSGDYEIVRYDLDNDFEKYTDATLKKTGGESINSFTATSTHIFIGWRDAANAYISKYDLDFTLTNDKLYTKAGFNILTGLIHDATYIYVGNGNANEIVQIHQTAFTTSVLNITGFTKGIDLTSNNLFWVYFDGTNTKIYSSNIASPFSSSTETLRKTLSGAVHSNIQFVIDTSNSWTYNYDMGRIDRYTDGITFTDNDSIVPGKISLTIKNNAGNGFSDFYAISIVDIHGQESHLMSGVKSIKNAGDIKTIKIYINATAEKYSSDLSSPSSDPTTQNSIWSDFRRIKKLRLYRAYAASDMASGPTTNYRFLSEIDINDIRWVEEINNEQYSFVYTDITDESDISSVTYEESAGLPETFKPYYTNWQYGIEDRGFFYYGNMRTDDLYNQQILQTPLNSPDIVYQHDQNIELFFPDDGDAIQGFATVWNRILIFKGYRTAVYNGLNRENVYDVGLTAPDSIVVHNNRAYFLFQKSIYALTPSGYVKISRPVDIYLASETGLANTSALYNPYKQKIWFHVRNSDTYCYNVNTETWDIYDLNTGAIDYVFVAAGVNDVLLGADSNSQKINYVDISTQVNDLGSNFSIYYVGPHLTIANDLLDARIMRLLMTFQAGDNITITLRYINKNGQKSKSITFDSSAFLKTQRKFLSGVFGQAVYIEINQAITGRFVLDNYSIYHTENKTQRINIG